MSKSKKSTKSKPVTPDEPVYNFGIVGEESPSKLLASLKKMLLSADLNAAGFALVWVAMEDIDEEHPHQHTLDALKHALDFVEVGATLTFEPGQSVAKLEPGLVLKEHA